MLLVYVVRHAKIFKEEYSKKSLKQEFILLAILAIFFVLLSCINTYSSEEPDADENSWFAFSTTEPASNNSISFIRFSLPACEEVYENRLKICKECDDLVAGTCLKCGCYVELRAAVTRNKCPAKMW